MKNQAHPLHVHRVEGRVLFLDFDGVLNATSGSAEVVRRFVWAPQLEVALRPFPEVCVVIHAAVREHDNTAALIRHMGLLGGRVIDIAPSGLTHWTAIQQWLARHPEIADYCILDSDARVYPADCEALIACAPTLGISDELTRARLRQWLVAGRQAHAQQHAPALACA
ncbi:MAG: HAD domain-containing protein [Pseudomonadota bacterium]